MSLGTEPFKFLFFSLKMLGSFFSLPQTIMTGPPSAKKLMQNKETGEPKPRGYPGKVFYLEHKLNLPAASFITVPHHINSINVLSSLKDFQQRAPKACILERNRTMLSGTYCPYLKKYWAAGSKHIKEKREKNSTPKQKWNWKESLPSQVAKSLNMCLLNISFKITWNMMCSLPKQNQLIEHFHLLPSNKLLVFSSEQ